MADGFKISLPVAGKLKLKFASFDALIQRLGRHISQDGIFIPTQQPKPAGTLLALEISLQNGDVILNAEGEVLWVRKNPTTAQSTGMGFRFINMAESSREFVWKVAHMNREAGIVAEVVVETHVTAENLAPEVVTMPSTQKIKEQGPVLGIDFGTCNSCVAVMQDNQAVLIPTERGGLIIPSVVALSPSGQILIGQPAKEQLLINPHNTIYGIKRFLGRHFRAPNVRNTMGRFPYKLKGDSQNNILATLGDKDYTLPEIVGMILGYLRECAQGYLQTEIVNAIITVPAYFTENQRGAIKLAASMAGLSVDIVFNEPTAAALAYGYNKDFEKRVLVFDLGGGTFDVSVLEVAANVFEVKGAGGDPFLGGLDFDQRLVEHIVQDFEKREKVAIRDNQVVMQRITSAAENAKIELSSQSAVNIHLPYITEKKGKPLDLKTTIEREFFNQLVNDLVERSLDICSKTIHGMGLMPSDIDEILLVGGQSRMPFLRQRIAEHFQKEPNKGAHPDEAVALGAALLGGSLQMIDGPMLLDMLAMALNRLLPDGSLQPLFAQGVALPAKQQFNLEALLKWHPNGLISIYQGNSKLKAECDYLGDVALELYYIQAEPKNVQIEFELTREGILNIRAHELVNNKFENLKLVMPQQSGEEAEVATPLVTPTPERKSLFGKIFGKGS